MKRKQIGTTIGNSNKNSSSRKRTRRKLDFDAGKSNEDVENELKYIEDELKKIEKKRSERMKKVNKKRNLERQIQNLNTINADTDTKTDGNITISKYATWTQLEKEVSGESIKVIKYGNNKCKELI